MKHLLLITIGSIAVVIGVIGLVIPLIPGFLFLIVAALCFATLFPALRNRLQRNPRMHRLFQRLDKTQHLSVANRVKLTFWAIIESVAPDKRRSGVRSRR